MENSKEEVLSKADKLRRSKSSVPYIQRNYLKVSRAELEAELIRRYGYTKGSAATIAQSTIDRLTTNSTLSAAERASLDKVKAARVIEKTTKTREPMEYSGRDGFCWVHTKTVYIREGTILGESKRRLK